MPYKALVAFGTAFGIGLLLLCAPAWCSAVDQPESAQHARPDTAPKPEKTPTRALPADALTLDEALQRSRQHNPTLAALAHELEARTFDTRQAGRLPNPELSVEFENLAGSGEYAGTDNAETTVRLSQRIELGGKRAQRQAVGQQAQQLAASALAIAAAELRAETRERFIAVLAAQAELALTEEQSRLTEQVLRSVEERIAAGKSARIEKTRFQAMAADARLRQAQARQALVAARRVLSTTWGSDTPDFEAIAGDLETTYRSPEWPELVQRLSRSPEIGYQQNVRIEATRSLALERANRVPDLTLSLGLKDDRASDDTALVAELALPLPLFDRNQDGVAAAQARQAKATAEARAAELRLLARLAEGWQTLQAVRTEVELLRSEVLPTTRQAFEAIAYGYEAGKFGVLDLLDAERTLFDAKHRYVDALVAYHRAVTALERLLGQTLFDQAETLAETYLNRQGHSS